MFTNMIQLLFRGTGDSKEGYYIGLPVPTSDPRSKKPLHGPNQYPSEGTFSLSTTNMIFFHIHTTCSCSSRVDMTLIIVPTIGAICEVETNNL
jgi:hypothetical protein